MKYSDKSVMEKHIKNPFQFGTIVKGSNFCNRKKELQELSTYIKDSYSVWLFSPRRYGKSSLVQKAFDETTNVKTIYFDLYNVRSLDDFCKKYAALLAKELFSWKQEIKKLTGKLARYFRNLHPTVSFDEYGSPSFSLGIAEIKQQYDVETILSVPGHIAKETNKTICIAFDEFQEIERIDPFLINWMRSAFQQQENVSYIFLGSQQSLMEKIFTNNHSPFYEFAGKMNIHPIHKKDLAEFIKQKFEENNLSISSKNIEEILVKSEGHPHFTQYFASIVFDLIRNGANQDQPEFTDTWIKRVIQGHSVFLQGVYDQLTNSQRIILLTITNLENDEELFSKESQKKYELPPGSSIVSALASLSKKGLIIKEDKRYRILNPVLKLWLASLN